MYLRSKLINMDAMRQPGRSGNINTGLKSMFSRHFVTCPEPTLELPPPPPSPVIVMSNETQDQATSQRYCLTSRFLLLIIIFACTSEFSVMRET